MSNDNNEGVRALISLVGIIGAVVMVVAYIWWLLTTPGLNGISRLSLFGLSVLAGAAVAWAITDWSELD